MEVSMSTSRTLAQAEWRSFFDRLSDAVVGKRIEIEATSLDLGDQIVAEWVPVTGITYDANDDLIDVSLRGLSHLIRHPRQILVQEGAGGVETVAVATEDEGRQILRLRDPLMVPA
jgi:hypothetical protein